MDLLAYDAMALGPKDLSLGAEELDRRLTEATFAVLSANVVRSGSGEPFARPYTVLERGGHRIAVVGLTRRESGDGAADFTVGDPAQALAEVVPQAAGEASTVILLTNIDLESAERLVGQVTGIDLVVAGNPMYVPDHAIRLTGSNTLAVAAERPSSGHSGRRVGRLNVTVGADGSLGGEAWSTLNLGSELADDKAMADLLAKFGTP
jgi:5'-nucleotidase / UDP-sugar diphosphatase